MRVNRVSSGTGSPGILACIAMITVIAAIEVPAWALRKNPTWDIRTKVQPDAEAGGWFINLGITGARGKIEVETPTVLEVAYVFKDTPAHERLEVGDRIIAANGKAFTTPHRFGYGMGIFGYEGPMMDFGDALEESQGDAELDGVLTLTCCAKFT